MILPAIVVAGSPPLVSQIEAALAGQPFRVLAYGNRTDYVARLVEDRAALILIDGSLPDWQSYAATSRADPATRRIPVVVVSDEESVIHQARKAGVDEALSPGALETGLAESVIRLARRQDDADLRQLDTACSQLLPPQAVEAIRKFNAGEYYKQHDLLEALWMETPGPERTLYQGILQIGIGYYQITRGNRRGALKMLLRARQWLDGLPDVCQGVDVARLRADAANVRDRLGSITDEEFGHFDRSLLKSVIMVSIKVDNNEET